jgi:hypothetical protein
MSDGPHSCWLCAVVLALACHTGERAPSPDALPPTVDGLAPPPPVPEPLDIGSPADDASGDGARRELAFRSVRIDIEAPPGVEPRHDAVNDSYTYDLAWQIGAQLRAIHEPAPSVFPLDTPGPGEGRILHSGRTGAGLPYSIQTFEVRRGAPSARGQVHWMEWVARVFVALPVDEGRHIRCTGYLERAVDDADDGDLQRLLRMCSSMRLLEVVRPATKP